MVYINPRWLNSEKTACVQFAATSQTLVASFFPACVFTAAWIFSTVSSPQPVVNGLQLVLVSFLLWA